MNHLVLIIRDFILGWLTTIFFNIYLLSSFCQEKKKNELPWNFYKEITQPFETFFVMISGLESNYVLELWNSNPNGVQMTKIDINVVLNLITCIFIHIHTATAAATLHWRHLAAQRGRVAKQNKRVGSTSSKAWIMTLKLFSSWFSRGLGVEGAEIEVAISAKCIKQMAHHASKLKQKSQIQILPEMPLRSSQIRVFLYENATWHF